MPKVCIQKVTLKSYTMTVLEFVKYATAVISYDDDKNVKVIHR
jgi:hypothetical protein